MSTEQLHALRQHLSLRIAGYSDPGSRRAFSAMLFQFTSSHCRCTGSARPIASANKLNAFAVCEWCDSTCIQSNSGCISGRFFSFRTASRSSVRLARISVSMAYSSPVRFRRQVIQGLMRPFAVIFSQPALGDFPCFFSVLNR